MTNWRRCQHLHDSEAGKLYTDGLKDILIPRRRSKLPLHLNDLTCLSIYNIYNTFISFLLLFSNQSPFFWNGFTMQPPGAAVPRLTVGIVHFFQVRSGRNHDAEYANKNARKCADKSAT